MNVKSAPASTSIRRTKNVVVFKPSDFQACLRCLLERRNFIAVGSLNFNHCLSRTEFLVTSVRCIPFSELAGEKLKNPTRIEIGLASKSASSGASYFIAYERDKIAEGGCVVKLALEESLNPEIASGIVVTERSTLPLHAVRVGANTIVTPDGGSLCLTPSPQGGEGCRNDGDKSPYYERRWSRLIGAIGGETWERMRRWEVCLVGIGRNGSLVAHSLVRMGVRKLTLIDHDVIEPHNLDAMDGVGEGDIGKPKALAVADNLKDVNSDVLLHPLPISAFTEEAVIAMKEADLLISCVDDNAARLLVNMVATRYLKPHLDIGTGIFETSPLSLTSSSSPSRGEGSNGEGGSGERSSRLTYPRRKRRGRQVGADVRMIIPGDGCLLCIGGAGDLRDNLKRLMAAQERSETPHPPWNRQRLGSLRSLNQITVSEGMRLLEMLAGGIIERSCWVRIEWDELIPQIRLVSCGSDPFCPLCALSGFDDY